METFISLVLEPLREVLLQFTRYSPNILALLSIVLVGLIAGRLTKAVVVKLLRTIKFDSWSDRMGLTSIMRKGDLWANPSSIAGAACFWLVVVVAVMAGFNALKIPAIENLVAQFFLYLPRIFSAILILVFGYMISGFIVRGVLIAAVNRGYYYTHVLVEVVRLLLMIMVFAMALEQLQIAPNIVLAAFSIIFGGVILSLVIALGVGGIEAARRIIEKEAEKVKKDIEHL